MPPRARATKRTPPPEPAPSGLAPIEATPDESARRIELLEHVLSGLAPIDAKPEESLRDSAWRALAVAAHHKWIDPFFWPVHETKGHHYAFRPIGSDRGEMDVLPNAGICSFVAGLALAHGDVALYRYLIELGKEEKR